MLVLETTSSSNVHDCTFRDCVAGSDGGVIQASSGAHVTVHRSEFSDCSATAHGGAIDATGKGTTFVGIACTILRCSSGELGGGVSSRGSARVTLGEGSVIAECTSLNGGGVSVANSEFELRASSIFKGSATTTGGCLLVNDAHVNILSSFLSDCTAGDGVTLDNPCNPTCGKPDYWSLLRSCPGAHPMRTSCAPHAHRMRALATVAQHATCYRLL